MPRSCLHSQFTARVFVKIPVTSFVYIFSLHTCNDFFVTGWNQCLPFRVVTKLPMTFGEVLSKWCVDPTEKDAQWGMNLGGLFILELCYLYNVQVWKAGSKDIKEIQFYYKTSHQQFELMQRDYPRIKVTFSSSNNTKIAHMQRWTVKTRNSILLIMFECAYLILKIRSYPNLPTHTHTDKYAHTHITEPGGSLHGTFMLHRDPVSVAWSSGNCSSTCLVLTDPAMYSLGILDTSCPRCGKNCLRLFEWFQTIFNMWSYCEVLDVSIPKKHVHVMSRSGKLHGIITSNICARGHVIGFTTSILGFLVSRCSKFNLKLRIYSFRKVIAFEDWIVSMICLCSSTVNTSIFGPCPSHSSPAAFLCMVPARLPVPRSVGQSGIQNPILNGLV